MTSLLIILLYIVFVLAAIVLVVVILLQEGKGGGLGQALGGHAQTTFGVGASGINRFTAAVAAIFLVSALLIHMLNRSISRGSALDGGSAIQDSGGAGGAGGGAGTAGGGAGTAGGGEPGR